MPSKSKNNLNFTRFLRWLATMLATYFIITAVFSLTVDPWRINQTRFSIESLDEYREISDTLRTGKAALANKGDWDTVIIGSSRMEIAFDPEHPALPGKRRVNLAMAAATLTETIAVANYTLDRNPGIKTMLFGIEVGELHNDADSRTFTDFYNSPYSDNNRSIERSINQIIGARSLSDSISTIRNKSAGIHPKRNQLGLWIGPEYPSDLRAFVEGAFAEGHREPEENWNLRPQDLRTAKADALSILVRRVRGAGIELHLVLPPMHALKMIHPYDDEPDSMAWETDLHRLAKICEEANAIPSASPPVKLWDFLLFNKHTCVALPSPDAEIRKLSNWTDLSHARPEIGNMALYLMFQQGGEGGEVDGLIGRNLLLGDWEDHRSSWILNHREYCRTNSNDVVWWRKLLKTSEPVRHPAGNR